MACPGSPAWQSEVDPWPVWLSEVPMTFIGNKENGLIRHLLSQVTWCGGLCTCLYSGLPQRFLCDFGARGGGGAETGETEEAVILCLRVNSFLIYPTSTKVQPHVLAI